MDFRLMHAPRVKCPIVGRGGDRRVRGQDKKSRADCRPAPLHLRNWSSQRLME